MGGQVNSMIKEIRNERGQGLYNTCRMDTDVCPVCAGGGQRPSAMDETARGLIQVYKIRRKEMKWNLEENGEPIEINPGFARMESCCDCDLAHLVLYEIKGDKIIKTSYRDTWLTNNDRKKNKITIYNRRE